MKKSLIFKTLYLFLILVVVAVSSVFATNAYLSARDISYGSTNVENALNDLYTLKGNDENYSTDEKAVGKWIDGKTIYRKCVQLSSSVTPTTSWSTRFSIPDSNKLINVIAISSADNTIRTSSSLFRIENGDFKDYKISEAGSYSIAIIEYTKTTN